MAWDQVEKIYIYKNLLSKNKVWALFCNYLLNVPCKNFKKLEVFIKKKVIKSKICFEKTAFLLQTLDSAVTSIVMHLSLKCL